jgi:hypothetical protein
MNLEIPEGLGDLLRDFTVAVLKERPPDLYDFAVEYFTSTREKRRPKEVPMYIIVEDDDEAGEPDPIQFKARSAVALHDTVFSLSIVTTLYALCLSCTLSVLRHDRHCILSVLRQNIVFCESLFTTLYISVLKHDITFSLSEGTLTLNSLS